MLDLKAINHRNTAAHAELSALCKGRRWQMSIPARPDYDSDLLIGAALRDIDALVEEMEIQRKTVAALQAIVTNLTNEIGRLVGDLDLIRRYCGENVAGMPIEARNKYLIVIIPTIVDHALNDMISGGEEAYAAIVSGA